MSEVKEIVELWRTTKLLEGMEPDVQEACAVCMENQRQRNGDYDSDRMSQFRRISIPVIRRVFGSEALAENNIELSSRLEPNAYNWKWVALGAHEDASGNLGQLDMDADYTLELETTCNEMLIRKASEQGFSRIVFGGIHLEQGMVYVLFDFE